MCKFMSSCVCQIFILSFKSQAIIFSFTPNKCVQVKTFETQRTIFIKYLQQNELTRCHNKMHDVKPCPIEVSKPHHHLKSKDFDPRDGSIKKQANVKAIQSFVHIHLEVAIHLFCRFLKSDQIIYTFCVFCDQNYTSGSITTYIYINPSETL